MAKDHEPVFYGTAAEEELADELLDELLVVNCEFADVTNGQLDRDREPLRARLEDAACWRSLKDYTFGRTEGKGIAEAVGWARVEAKECIQQRAAQLCLEKMESQFNG